MVATVLDLPPSGGYSRIPHALREIPGWLLWKKITVAGEAKARKVPFYTNGERRAGPQGTDRERTLLSSFDVALAAYIKGGYDGLGFATLKEWGIVGLDFDNCVVDGVVRGDVLELVAETYAEISPSGKGVHAFMRGLTANRKSLDVVPAVEFFSTKGFLTMTGRVLPECEILGSAELVLELTPAVKELYAERFGAAPGAGGALELAAADLPGGFDEHALETMAATLSDLDLTRAKSLLDVLNPDESYEDWLKVGMALHQQFDGARDALALWDEWSRGGAKYRDAADLETRWAGFGRTIDRAPVTARWLIKRAKEKSARLPYEAAARWATTIASAMDEFTLRETICPQIRRDGLLGKVERMKLAATVQGRLKDLGTKIDQRTSRDMVEFDAKALLPAGGPPKPAWLASWVYVTLMDKFHKIDTEEWLTTQGFCAKYNREIPLGVDGTRPSAAYAATTELRIPTVTKPMYVPWEKPLFVMSGVKCVNTYRPSTVPEAVPAGEAFIPAAAAAVKLVHEHVLLLCGGRADVAAQLIAWMALNVRDPGRRIRFAPLIKGVEGDGKSLLGTMMAAVMGQPNVRSVSPKVLNTDFNGYAEGCALNVLEEIKLTGHNRHDVLNALKPLITNDWIPIHRKGVDEYNALNTTNYMAFTNHFDALPLNDTDRRWWVIFTPFLSLTDLAARVGDPASYFVRLHAAIRDHGPALRRWLLDADVSLLDPNGPAPDTDEKRSMIAAGRSSEEDVVRMLIEHGGRGVTGTILTTSCLADLAGQLAFSSEEGGLPATTALNRVLGKLGYAFFGRVKWVGEGHRVWVRGVSLGLPNEEIRKLLDTTDIAS